MIKFRLFPRQNRSLFYPLIHVIGRGFYSSRQVVLLYFIINLALVLTGCTDLFSSQGSKLVDRSFITGEPCEAPCWQGLKLNEATLDQIYPKLKELQFVDPDSIITWEHVTSLGFTNATIIRYDCFGYTDGGCGYLLLSNGVLKVSNHMILYELPLNNVVEKLGAPDHVIFNPYSSHQGGCALDFEWPKKNLLVSSYNYSDSQWCLDLQDDKALDPGINVTQVTYMVPEAFLPDRCREGNCISWPGFN